MNDYPILKVTLLYAFLGSAIGGLLVTPQMLLLGLLFGLILGFIPAWFTGLIIAILGLTKDNPNIIL